MEFCKEMGHVVKSQSSKATTLELKWAIADKRLSIVIDLQPKQAINCILNLFLESMHAMACNGRF